jgi:excisionase family DNA binding protein
MSTTPEPAALLTAKQVALQLSLSLSAVYSLADSGEIPAYRLGAKRGSLRFEPADVEDYKRRSRVVPVVNEGRRKSVHHGAVGGLKLLRAAGYKG